MEKVRLFLLLALIFCVVAGITYLLHRIYKKNIYVKYFPPVAMLIAGMNNIYLSTKPYTGFEDIGRIITALMLLTGFAAGLLSALFLDFIFPKLKKS